MLKPHGDGSLSGALPLYKKQHYDIANDKVLAQSDGSFGLSRYAVAGLGQVLTPDSFYAVISVDGINAAFDTEKRIRLIGATAETRTTLPELELECSIFLDSGTQAAFQELRLTNTSGRSIRFGYDFGFLLDSERFWEGGEFSVVCNALLTLREAEGYGKYYGLYAELDPGEARELRLVYSYGGEAAAREQLNRFDGAKQEAERFCAFLQNAARGKNLTERALYISALNCALSSYKSVGDFRGFYAGVNYQSPPRTYYRDGYFTILPVLSHRPELVREEILTLALGIQKDGTCPSAVIDADSVFWYDHLDSPALFVIMLHDSLAAARDFALLDERVNGKSVLDWALFLADALLDKSDGRGLLYRPALTRRDWVDNVYREGYVTYVEALFFRAVYCAGRICAALGRDGSRYLAESVKIRDAINEYLWDGERGRYVNYRSDNCLEDHLSIDTVLCVLFGIADGERARRLLTNMEKTLETANNKAQPFGDWGTMCVFPPYKYSAHPVEKSAYPFVYHNGSDWPYWSSLYAFCKGMYGMDYTYPLTRWFEYSLEKGWATPVEYFNPVTGRGSLLQAWSGAAAFALRFMGRESFPFEL